MITDIDSFLKKEGMVAKVKVEHERKVRRGETKKEREARYKRNFKEMLKLNKVLLSMRPDHHTIEILDSYDLSTIVPETCIDVDNILLEGIKYYNETGNIRYKVTKYIKNAIFKSETF